MKQPDIVCNSPIFTVCLVAYFITRPDSKSPSRNSRSRIARKRMGRIEFCTRSSTVPQKKLFGREILESADERIILGESAEIEGNNYSLQNFKKESSRALCGQPFWKREIDEEAIAYEEEFGIRADRARACIAQSYKSYFIAINNFASELLNDSQVTNKGALTMLLAEVALNPEGPEYDDLLQFLLLHKDLFLWYIYLGEVVGELKLNSQKIFFFKLFCKYKN